MTTPCGKRQTSKITLHAWVWRFHWLCIGRCLWRWRSVWADLRRGKGWRLLTNSPPETPIEFSRNYTNLAMPSLLHCFNSETWKQCILIPNCTKLSNFVNNGKNSTALAMHIYSDRSGAINFTSCFYYFWHWYRLHQVSVQRLIDCSHSTKFSPIFSFLISARYSVNNGWWTHSAHCSVRHHRHNVKLNNGPTPKMKKKLPKRSKKILIDTSWLKISKIIIFLILLLFSQWDPGAKA